MKDMDTSTKNLDRASKGGKRKPKLGNSDSDMESFFGQMATMPTASTAQAALDKARREGRTAYEATVEDLPRPTIPIRKHTK